MSKVNFHTALSIVKGFFATIFVIAVICGAMALPLGWGLNVYKLTQCDFEPSYKAEAIRSIGVVVAPVGMVVGYMDIGK